MILIAVLGAGLFWYIDPDRGDAVTMVAYVIIALLVLHELS